MSRQDGWPEDGIVRLGPAPGTGEVRPGVTRIDAEDLSYCGPFREWFIDVQGDSVSCVRRVSFPREGLQ